MKAFTLGLMVASIAHGAPAPKPRPDAGTAKSASAKAASKDAGVPAPKDAGASAPKDAGVTAPKDAGASGPKDAGVAATAPAARDAGAPAAAVAAGPLAAPDKKTERLWKSKCSACHGADGKGATEKGRKMHMSDLTTAAWQKSRTNEQLRKGIVDGVDLKKDGVDQKMDEFGSELSPEQVTDLLGYVRWFGAPH